MDGMERVAEPDGGSGNLHTAELLTRYLLQLRGLSSPKEVHREAQITVNGAGTVCDEFSS